MSAPKKLANRIVEINQESAQMRKYLELTTWTPAMGALLISGIQAPISCTEIPHGGVGIDNKILHGSERSNDARRILKKWKDFCDDLIENGESPPPHEMHPIDFLNWCDDEEIDTRVYKWYASFRDLLGCPVEGASDISPSMAAQLKLETTVSVDIAEDGGQNEQYGPQPFPPGPKSKFETARIKEKLPEGLPTPIIAAAFDGLSDWNTERWKKSLSEAAWATDAILQRGRPGKGRPTLWNPVRLAELAHFARGISIKKFDRIFRKLETLSSWREEWKLYEETLERFSDD